MKVVPDTNVLVRAVVNDEQGETAQAALAAAELLALPISTLCELVWVLRSTYKRPTQEISASITALIEAGSVVTNQAAARAGIDVLLAGGDFADGAIAYEGRQLGADIFLTFDRKAARLVEKSGFPATLLK